MPVRYYDETQELIQAYKDDTSADSEGADRDNSHVAARESGDYPELDSFQDPNVADDPDQAYEDAAGNIEGKFFQYIYIIYIPVAINKNHSYRRQNFPNQQDTPHRCLTDWHICEYSPRIPAVCGVVRQCRQRSANNPRIPSLHVHREGGVSDAELYRKDGPVGRCLPNFRIKIIFPKSPNQVNNLFIIIGRCCRPRATFRDRGAAPGPPPARLAPCHLRVLLAARQQTLRLRRDRGAAVSHAVPAAPDTGTLDAGRGSDRGRAGDHRDPAPVRRDGR